MLKDEIDFMFKAKRQLTKKQAELVDFLKIGELLDEWDSLPNDIKGIPEIDKLGVLLNRIAFILE